MIVKTILEVVLWCGLAAILFVGQRHLLASEKLVLTVTIQDAQGNGVRSTASLGGVLRVSDRRGRIVFTGMEPNRYILLVSPEPPYRTFQTTVTVPSPSNAMVFVLEKP